MKKLLLAILLFSALRLSAATITATTSGSWTDAATWGGQIPSAGDVAIIPAGITVTYPVDDNGAGGKSHWNNPAAIKVYGTYEPQGNADDLYYNNPVTIEVFPGGLLYDNSAFCEFYLQNGSSVIVHAGGSWNTNFYYVNVINSSGTTNDSKAWPGATDNNPGPFTLSLNGDVFTYTPSAPLPLKLLSFEANQQGKQIVLNWKTADEINTSGFDVEKSVDGKSFNVISHTNAKGASGNLYSSSDNNPFPGENFYRLKMIDRDGSFTYSNVVNVTYAGISSVIKVYPVPATSYVNFNVAATGTLYIYNINGLILKKQFLTTGINRIDVSGLNDGIYYYRLNGYKGSFSKTGSGN